MTYRAMIRASVVVTAVLLLLTPAASAKTENHSGTIAAIDHAKGTMVLNEVGPWRGATVITRRVITLRPTTEVTLVKRASDEGASGWLGDFVEKRLGARDLKTGAMVTVKCEHAGKRLTALKVTVVEPAEP